ncbi:MAG: N-acetyl-gamma-glutamyl-phosphate reductase [Acidobacteria bacterium]|nr:N-acetyl-gamma-glutamyl-phosphate reductase [Acidobacteriota bacterium]MBI3655486.1 N-acetyl-gamma-glutamyl-phosphate reductase [Acidobacteriota bacterium]
MKIRVAIVGATGYTGYELIRLLVGHPHVEIVAVMASEGSADQRLEEIHPQLRSLFAATVEAYHPEKIDRARLNLVFTATPDEVSVKIVPELMRAGLKVIDLSGAYRLKDPEQYRRWYGGEHGSPELLRQAVYGLPETNGPAILKATLVANPGCYPTSTLLPLIPILASQWLDPGQAIICDAKSGVSGAGKAVNAANIFMEINESFKPYQVLSHRHTPEIRQELKLDRRQGLLFVPHLLPINRGILSTIYVGLKCPVTHDEVYSNYARYYGDKPFIRLYPRGEMPELKFVNGSNFCDMGWVISEDGRHLVVVAAIDNLMKGAAGQAIQNFNLMYGLPESTGLPLAGGSRGMLLADPR